MKNNIISCKKCLYTSDHPFGLTINEDGICSGCVIHEEKNNLDWGIRLDKLKALLNEYRSKDKSHDCVVHIDGSAESFYVVYLLTRILDMNPLLVNFNSHFMTDVGITNVDQLVTSFDLNMYQCTLSPTEYKNLVKHSVLKLKNVYWPYIAGKTSLPYRMAVKLNIPLVIHGGLQTIEQVGMFSHEDNVEYSRWYRKQHDLMGVDENDFLSASGAINENLISLIKYPDDLEILNSGVRGIFLSNYFRWDPWAQNIKMLDYGFTPQHTNRSFDSFENAGCSVYFGIHDVLRGQNCGYTKSREHLSREIRFNRISKENALILYNEYRSKFDENIVSDFYRWLNISLSGKEWVEEFLLQRVNSEKNTIRISNKIFNPFAVENNKSAEIKESFKLFGKGI